MNTLKRNCFYYQIYTYCKKSLLLFYVLTLYYLALGLSYTSIAIVSVIGTVSTLVSEVPTGVIADRWSRKKSLQVSELLKIVSLIFLLFGKNFFVLCLSSLIWGVAESCESGADQALLYELFDDKKEYDLFLSKVYSRGYVASACSTMIATVLFSVNIYLPVLISLLLIIVAFLAVSCLQEIKTNQATEESNFLNFNHEVLHYMKGNQPLLNILILMSVCTIAVMSINSYCQPLLLEKGIDLKVLGVLMFLYNLTMSLGAKVYKKMKFKNLQFVLAAGLGFGAVAVGHSNLLFSIVIFGMYRFINGMIWPSLTYRSNQVLKSEVRATVMSYQNMITSILCIFIDPAVGVALDYLGIGNFYTVFGFICITMVALLFVWYLKLQKSENKESVSE